MYHKDEFTRNREALELQVRMRKGGGNYGASAASYTPANKLTSLFGLLIIASAALPLGVLTGILPKSTVAGIPIINEIPGLSSPHVATTAPATTKGHKHHKHGKKVAHVQVSHQATGRILNAE